MFGVIITGDEMLGKDVFSEKVRSNMLRFAQYTGGEEMEPPDTTQVTSRMQIAADNLQYVIDNLQPNTYGVQQNYRDQQFFNQLQQVLATLTTMIGTYEDIQMEKYQTDMEAEREKGRNTQQTYNNTQGYGNMLPGNY